MAWRDLGALLTTLGVSLIGALVFSFLSLPLPWLLGSIFALLIATRFPAIRLLRPRGVLLHVARGILGVAIGATFAPGLLDQVGSYLVSLSLVIPYLLLVAALGWLYYRQIVGFDRQTAFFCALPGGLAELALLGEEVGADVRRLLLTHSTRVLLLVYTLPFVIQALSGIELGARSRLTQSLLEIPPEQLAVMVAVGVAGWYLARRVGLSGASIVGPMILGAAVSLAGYLSHRPPDEAMKLAQLVLGSAIGATFTGLAFREMLRVIVLSLGLMAILLTATGLFALLVQALTGFSLVSAILAFAPGGQAEMSLIAILVGENVPYVALHHVLRMSIIIAVIPTVYRLLYARRQLTARRGGEKEG